MAQGRGQAHQILAHNRRPETCRSAASSISPKLRWRIEHDYRDLQAGKSALDIMRAAAGRVSIITAAVHRSLRFPDLRTGEDSPLRTTFRPLESKNLPFPVVIDPRRPRIRPQAPRSLKFDATIRPQCWVVAIATTLQRCQCRLRRLRANHWERETYFRFERRNVVLRGGILSRRRSGNPYGWRCYSVPLMMGNPAAAALIMSKAISA